MLIKCPECKKKISDSVEICPNCGRKLTEEMIIEATNKKEKDKKRRKVIRISVLVFVVLVAIGSVTTYFVIENNKRIEEEKRIEKKKEQERKKKEEEEERKKKIHSEKGKYKQISIQTESKTANLENILNKYSVYISNTWINCIYETNDKETDKWTKKKNGKFKDFNDGVYDCTTDLFQRKKYTKAYKEFIDSLEKWRKAEKYTVAGGEYKGLTDALNEYIKKVNHLREIVSVPEGNHESYVESVNNSLDECTNAHSDATDAARTLGLLYYW